MTPFYYVALSLIALYLEIRAYQILRGKNPGLRIFLAVLIALSMGLYPYLMMLGVTHPWPNAHEALSVIGVFFSTAAFFSVFLLILDVIWLISFIITRLFRGRRCGNRMPLKLYGGLLALCAVLAVWGGWNVKTDPPVKNVAVTVPRLPADLDGLKIVQLTDIHVSPLYEKERFTDLVKKVNAQNPDFIFITGDIADGTPQSRRAIMPFLHDLKAKIGVVMIPGNHDYYVDYTAWRHYYKSIGVPFLENGHVEFRKGDDVITVVGMTDRSGIQYGYPRPDIEKATFGADASNALRIGLIHRPEDAAKWADPRWGLDLLLAGHTHGGQIFIMYPSVWLQNHGYVRGLYHVGNIPFYVSPGIGSWSGTPTRIGAPTEITLLTLHSPEKTH